jgi:hypothetical protein
MEVSTHVLRSFPTDCPPPIIESTRFFFVSLILFSSSYIILCLEGPSLPVNLYEYFGDVLSVDTTFHTNQFKMPFSLILGTNHHKQTIVFLVLHCYFTKVPNHLFGYSKPLCKLCWVSHLRQFSLIIVSHWQRHSRLYF